VRNIQKLIYCSGET